MKLTFSTPLEQVPYIGSQYKSRLAKLHLATVEDLLWHVPFRYEDTRTITPIGSIDASGEYTIKGSIREIRNIYTRNGKKLTQATIEDDSGMADVVWFNQHYLTSTLKAGSSVVLSGKVEHDLFRSKLISPNYELDKGEESMHLARISGVYPETQGISSKWLRSRIKYIIEHVDHELIPYFSYVHFPQNEEQLRIGKERLSFEEMLRIQLIIVKRRLEQQQRTGKEIPIDRAMHEQFTSILPFSLTSDQEHAIEDLFTDIAKDKPMNRLLQGDVGSGKTVVAAAGALQAAKAGFRTIVLAPTSILAMQHYLTLQNILEDLPISLGLVTAKQHKKEDFLKDIVVGTHAVLFGKEHIENVGLVIIDEQHRFGVSQREMLETLHPYPHVLSMSATPIPRTLAMALYADIDLSIITQLPKGRKTIATHIVPSNKRDDAYQFIRRAIQDRGEQAYIICPLIEESDKLDAKSVIAEYHRLQEQVFPDLKLGLLHGQLKAEEKDAVLADFKEKKYDILIATSVIEVGIDVPNSTIIAIEGAERFGLAQLHQLRGRVGRGSQQSYCFLFPSMLHGGIKERLTIFCEKSSGLELAEFDLQNRGPGEVYGTRQSGIPMVKLASFQDITLITKARKAAEDILLHHQ